MDAHQNRWFLDPVLRGTYPVELLEHYERTFGTLPALHPEDLDVISRPLDFLGVNYYNPTYVRELGRRRRCRPSAVTAARADDRDGLAGRRERSVRPARPVARRLRRPRDLDHRERCGVRRRAAGRRRRRGPLARGVPVRRTSRRCGGRSRTASTSPATTRGPCSTTSSGNMATTSASGSCASTTTPRSASRSGARSGTGITSRVCGGPARWHRSRLRDVSQGLPGRDEGRRRAGPGDRRRRVHDPGRAVRLGEVDRAADGRRARGRHRGCDHDRRAGRQRRRAARPRHRDGLPVLRAVPAHDGRREHGLRAEDAKAGQGVDRVAGGSRRRRGWGSAS